MNQESLKSRTPPRHAFTMIELVFIIVILGILGAIAVPKMAASREDAQFVALKQDVATIIQALPAYALSQGADKITKFSDAATLSSDIWVALPAKDGHYLANADNTLQGASHLAAKHYRDSNHCLTMRLLDWGDDKVVDEIELWISNESRCTKLTALGFPVGTTNIPLLSTSVKF